LPNSQRTPNLQFNRQVQFESQLKNRAIACATSSGFTGLEAFRRLVVETNSNDSLKSPQTATGSRSYNKDEEIAWSIKVATLGWGSFVDAPDSEEYQTNFGDTTVPYQRRRFKIDPLTS